jgi:hypothetical protein
MAEPLKPKTLVELSHRALSPAEAQAICKTLSKHTDVADTNIDMVVVMPPEGVSAGPGGRTVFVTTDGDADFAFNLHRGRVRYAGKVPLDGLMKVAERWGIHEKARPPPLFGPDGDRQWPPAATTAPPLREWETREALSAHISRKYFPVAPRTLSSWPGVRSIIINKRLLLNVAEAEGRAQEVIAEAVAQAVVSGSEGSGEARAAWGSDRATPLRLQSNPALRDPRHESAAQRWIADKVRSGRPQLKTHRPLPKKRRGQRSAWEVSQTKPPGARRAAGQ